MVPPASVTSDDHLRLPLAEMVGMELSMRITQAQHKTPLLTFKYNKLPNSQYTKYTVNCEP